MALLEAASSLRLDSPLSPGLADDQPKSSALASRVAATLSASYADIDIRDALGTLDSKGVRNSPAVRRNLRRDVQKETIDCNGEIVDDFGLVASQLRTVGAALQHLQQTCAEIRRHVSLAQVETRPVLDEARSLLARKNDIETKQRVLDAFNGHFLLSDDELKALTSGAEPVGDDYFRVLTKAKRIHKDSQVLLGGSNQRLGLEILEQSTKNLNAAFQKLYWWIQREFKSLDLENPRINASIRRALRVLAERPTLFQSCLDAFAESRERTLSETFHAALTGSTYTSQRPIDFSAHEPLRYVGDMLAWAHSTAVSEREALEALFISEGDEISRGIEAGLESEPWSRDEDAEAFDGRKALGQLVNRSLTGVAGLLSQRIDQVVHGHDDPVLAYKVANLVAFYHNIFTKLVDKAGFLDTLRKVEDSAIDRFRATMRYSVSNMQSEITAAPADLGPPEFVRQALDALRALVKSYETSLTSRGKGGDDLAGQTRDDERGINLIYAEALDPYLAACSSLAAAMPPHRAAIFLVNILGLVRSALTPSGQLTAAKTAQLGVELAGHAEALKEDQHRFLAETSGLAALLAGMDAGTALDPDRLAAASEQLDAFLPSAGMDAEARIASLLDKKLARDVVVAACSLFTADFERAEDLVEAYIDNLDDDARAGELRAAFPRTVEDVRVLLLS